MSEKQIIVLFIN